MINGSLDTEIQNSLTYKFAKSEIRLVSSAWFLTVT